MSLPPRLAAIAALIPPDCAVADIGADHGLLSRHLAARGQRVIAIEHNAGPYAALRQRSAGLPGLELRQGDGLGPLAPGEVDCAVMAGMGARTMLRILAGAPRQAAALSRLVLQPQTEAWRLAEGLVALGWARELEQEVEEQGRRYLLSRWQRSG
jgi:tRNA (adenine22-N1)-methyltransferase